MTQKILMYHVPEMFYIGRICWRCVAPVSIWLPCSSHGLDACVWQWVFGGFWEVSFCMSFESSGSGVGRSSGRRCVYCIFVRAPFTMLCMRVRTCGGMLPLLAHSVMGRCSPSCIRLRAYGHVVAVRMLCTCGGFGLVLSTVVVWLNSLRIAL